MPGPRAIALPIALVVAGALTVSSPAGARSAAADRPGVARRPASSARRFVSKPNVLFSAGGDVSGTTVLVEADGHPRAIGANFAGQLATGDTTDRQTLTPMTGLPPGVVPTAVSGGGGSSYMLGSNGKVYVAGDAPTGPNQGSITYERLRRVKGIPHGVRARQVSAGEDHVLVLGSNGVAYAAGSNELGQLGCCNGFNSGRLRRMKGLPHGVRAIAVAASSYFSMVLGSNHRVYGVGMDNDEIAPVLRRLTLPHNMRAKAIAGYPMALGRDGHMYLWTLDTNDLTPNRRRMPDLPRHVKVRSITAYGDAIAIGVNGVAYGLGANFDGSLGVGDTKPHHTWTRMLGLPHDVRAVAASSAWYTLVLGSDGLVYGSGMNDEGQLGTGDTVERHRLTLMHGQKATLAYVHAHRPRLTGIPAAGHKLRIKGAGKRRFQPDATRLTYRWYRNGHLVRHATADHYPLRRKDRGKRIRARVTAHRSGRFAVTVLTTAMRIRR